MKKTILTIIITSFIFLVGCTSLPQENEPKENEGNNIENLMFDIDLSSLDYKLPSYTKICIPETKQFCSKEGCEQIKASVFVLYDNNNKLLYRCDEKPCDVYEVDVYPSGIFKYLRPKNAKDLSLKIADDPTVKTAFPEIENEYIELLGTGLEVMVSNGKCR